MPRWKKNHNYALIHTRRAYSFADIATTLGIHVRTVQSWRKNGLTAMDENIKPLLFKGVVVRSFLKGRRRVIGSLKDDDFLCLTCHAIRQAKEGTATVIITKKRARNGLSQIIISALCASCGNKMSRFSTTLSQQCSSGNTGYCLGTDTPTQPLTSTKESL